MADSTSKPPKIDPLEGWEPNCRYGLQRANETNAGRLVRLETVATWLAQELPRDRVVQELFGRLITEGEAECLYVLSARTFAVPLTVSGRANVKAAGFWQHLDFVDSNTLAEFVVREIGNAWDDCWPGLADLNTDQDWYMQRVIAANRERNRFVKLMPPGDVPKPRPASFDIEDRQTQLERLRKLALPIEKAYALWGWGSVAAPAAVVLQLVPEPIAKTAINAVPPKPKTMKDMHPELTGQVLEEMRKKHERTHAPTQTLAAETGLSDREIRRRIKAWSDSKSNPIGANAFTVKPTGTGGQRNKR
ncbi:hypothetical protein [Acidovorax sp.]|uniref:hypothetical protein n=1 Tax=Acidovorax sp. TaxID=1872122 RepID=UPI002F97D5D5